MVGSLELVQNAHRFNWFGHMYNHFQPHNLTEEQLVEYMTKNLQFAKVRSLKPESLLVLASVLAVLNTCTCCKTFN